MSELSSSMKGNTLSDKVASATASATSSATSESSSESTSEEEPITTSIPTASTAPIATPASPSPKLIKTDDAVKILKANIDNIVKTSIPIIDTLGAMREIFKLSNIPDEAIDVLAKHLLTLKNSDNEPIFKNELEAKKFLDDVKQGNRKIMDKLKFRSDVVFSRLDTNASHAKPNNPMLLRGLYRSNNSFYRY